MKKKSYILIYAAAAFIIFLSIGTLLIPDVVFSPDENRYLTEKPDFTVKRVLDGTFERKYEEYLSDQIIGRNRWVEAKSLTEAALGINDINGVYLCTGGRAVERITENDFDWSNYEKNLQRIEDFTEICTEQEINVHIMPVPTGAYVYREFLPDNAIMFDEGKAFSQAADAFGSNMIDIRNSLMAGKHEGDVFFKTDHHWTGRGARLAAAEFIGTTVNKAAAEKVRSCDTEIISSEFKGTLYSKVLLKTLGTDIIETSAYARKADMKVEIEGEEYDSLYFDENLNKKDKYAVYFGGNYGLVKIRATAGEKERKESEKLLIVKDSFANSMVPFLLNDFPEITMVDTRFYRGDISRIVEEYDRVLFVYSVNNLSEEKIVLTGSLS